MTVSEDYQKGMKYATKLVHKAVCYKNRYGYRENLGYYDDCKLEDYLNNLRNLSYQERTTIIQNFYRMCDRI